MPYPIQAIRLKVLITNYQQYIIDLYNKRDNNFPTYPKLNKDEFLEAFTSRKAGIRSSFRLLSIAALCEYISTSLSKDLSSKLQSLQATQLQLRYLKINEPLIFLLLQLHNNGFEIDSNKNNTYIFESFFIQESEWRSNKKFIDVIQYFKKTTPKDYEHSLRKISHNFLHEATWEKAHSQESGNDQASMFLRTLQLVTFLNELQIFISKVPTPLLKSCFKEYYYSFLESVKQQFDLLTSFMQSLKDIARNVSPEILADAENKPYESKDDLERIERMTTSLNILLFTNPNQLLTEIIDNFEDMAPVSISAWGDLVEEPRYTEKIRQLLNEG